MERTRIKGGEMPIKSGLAFHCHHDTLIEYVYDFDERVATINNWKPAEEQELRLRLFKMIPETRLPKNGRKAYSEALEAYREASKAYREAEKAYSEALEAYREALEARREAWKAYSEVEKAYSEAEKAYIEGHRLFFKKLHKELCPDCPWDGHSIFKEEK